MALKLTVSFKDTEDEKNLYEWVKEHSNYSGFIKDLLKKEMKKELGLESPKRKTEKINLIDF